jgi:putative SOS response-associated peptidase YedK
LSREKEKLWLQPDLEKDDIQSMLVPFDMERMEAHTVPNLVNKLGFNTQIATVLERQEYPDLPE